MDDVKRFYIAFSVFHSLRGEKPENPKMKEDMENNLLNKQDRDCVKSVFHDTP